MQSPRGVGCVSENERKKKSGSQDIGHSLLWESMSRPCAAVCGNQAMHPHTLRSRADASLECRTQHVFLISSGVLFPFFPLRSCSSLGSRRASRRRDGRRRGKPQGRRRRGHAHTPHIVPSLLGKSLEEKKRRCVGDGSGACAPHTARPERCFVRSKRRLMRTAMASCAPQMTPCTTGGGGTNTCNEKYSAFFFIILLQICDVNKRIDTNAIMAVANMALCSAMQSQ